MNSLPDLKMSSSSDDRMFRRVEVLEKDVRELKAWKHKKNESELELMDQRTGETLRLGNLSTPFSDMHYEFTDFHHQTIPGMQEPSETLQ